jgi:hypothetical protein
MNFGKNSYLFRNLVNILEMFSKVLDADIANAAFVSLEGREVFGLFASTHFPNPFDVSAPSNSMNILENKTFFKNIRVKSVMT